MNNSDRYDTKRKSLIPAIIVLGVLAIVMGCSTKPGAKEPPALRAEQNRAAGFLSQGNKQFDAGLYSAADGSYNRALDIYGALNDNGNVVRTLLALVRSDLVQGRNSQALERLEYAQLWASLTSKKHYLRAVLNARAEYHVRIGEPEKALELCDGKLVPDLPDLSPERGAMYRVKGKALKRLNRLEEAEKALEKALKIDSALFLEGDMAADCYVLASVYSVMGRYKKAVEYAKQALELDRKNESFTGIAADLTALALIHEKSGDTKTALVWWHRAYMAWRGLGFEKEKKEAADAIHRLSGDVTVKLP